MLGYPAVHILDTSTGEVIQNLQEPLVDSSSEVAWSPDGTQLAASGGDGVIAVWNTATWETEHILTDTSSGALGLQWSPDGSKIASIVVPGVIDIWDAETGQKIFTIVPTLPIGTLFDFDWSPDGNEIAVAVGTRVRIFDVATGRTILVTGTESEDLLEGISAVSWSPDGSKLAYGGNGVDFSIIEPDLLPTATPSAIPNS